MMQPSVELAPAQFVATVSRQFSLWPFGTRHLRLFLTADPSPAEPALLRALLRAMQQAFFRCETGSQTTALRASIEAAHRILRHRNRDALAHDQATAAAAAAASRGGMAYVALAGEAMAFSWSAGILSVRRTAARLPRPLGTDQQPRIAFWSAPLGPADRLVLACGGAWHDATFEIVQDILSSSSAELAEPRLAEALAGADGPARVLVAEGFAGGRRGRQPVVAVPSTPRPASAHTRAGGASRPTGRRRHRLWLASVLLVVLLLGVATTGRAARSLIQPVASGPLLVEASQQLDESGRTYPVEPAIAVDLGPAAARVVDLAIADETLYTLDGVDGSLRGFRLGQRGQQPTPDTLRLRPGMAVEGRELAMPVAIRYVPGPRTPRDREGSGGDPEPADDGLLTVVDQLRTVVQLRSDGSLAARQLPGSLGWQRLAALGADSLGNLFVLDSGARELLVYAGAGQRLTPVEPPRPMLDPRGAASFPFERVAELVVLRDVYARLEDGSLHRLDRRGQELPFLVQPPDGPAGPLSGVADDAAGGLYLADPSHQRILHATAEGRFIRQLRAPAFGGLRQIQASLDGRRLFGLVGTGVLVVDLPPDVPAPLPGEPTRDTVAPPPTQIAK